MANDPRLDTAIAQADSLFAGDVSAVPFMKFISSAETDYGRHNDETALSYGPFQIDPIRYYDIAQNPSRLNPTHQARLDKANEFLRGKFNDPEFDIQNLATYNPETNDYIPESRNLNYLRDPSVGAILTRLALKQSPEQIPQGDNMVSGYENMWGPKWSQSDDENLKSQKRQQAIDKYDLYHNFEDPVNKLFSDNDKLNGAFPKE